MARFLYFGLEVEQHSDKVYPVTEWSAALQKFSLYHPFTVILPWDKPCQETDPECARLSASLNFVAIKFLILSRKPVIEMPKYVDLHSDNMFSTHELYLYL